MLALVDVNNFYVSCERVFKPSLNNKPVIVLSNNDGCIISRSNEAKAITGIKMGIPYFEIKNIVKKHNIQTFSSNYTLYADLSNRTMSILREFAIRQEIYSIDESFLDLTGITSLTLHGQKIKATIKKWVGLPVGIGIAETKVLAKFANYLAKKYRGFDGVCNLDDLGKTRVDKAMQLTPIDEVWGIGRKISYKLKLMGIKTIFDLKNANPKHLRNMFNINIEKIINELNGIPCIALEDYHELQQRIVSSRSFGAGIKSYDALLSSLTHHVEQASKKLRKQGLYTRQLTVFINTNRFKDDCYWHSKRIILPQAVDSFRYLAHYLEDSLKELYVPGLTYKKSGIMLSDLITSEHEYIDLFDTINIRKDPIIGTLELIKRKFGKTAIDLAASKLNTSWNMRQDNLSPRYTTDINELLTIS
ncbi:MAG: Y-family DNA polymerase [Neisseriaceae bacterium]